MGERIAVSFPNIGLDFNISREAFRINFWKFDFPVYWYGIIIALAFFVCVLWAMRDSRKFDMVPETVIDLMLFAAPSAIIFARLYYVIFSWENYKYDPIQIVNLRNGGLAIFGGIIGAVITAYFVARYKKIPTFKFFDFAIPYVALGQAIGRWGNFFNQEAFGTNTSLPWGMTSPAIKSYLLGLQSNGVAINPDLPVHPTFLYESAWDLVVFAFLMWLRKKKKVDGEVFCLYFITYSIGRAVIEGLRTDSLMLGNLRVSQLLSIVLIIVFTVFVIYLRSKAKNSEVVEVGHSGYANVLKIIEEEDKELEAQKPAEQKSSDGSLHSEEQNSEDIEPEEPGQAEFEKEENQENQKDELQNSEVENPEDAGSSEEKKD
ncbi:MAG: prolipoprotein diacylglyceryl transferase [Eubacterium sp.]|nr:prolipoprotein diacylglyceryl transferase [Eubacterium sp.]